MRLLLWPCTAMFYWLLVGVLRFLNDPVWFVECWCKDLALRLGLATNQYMFFSSITETSQQQNAGKNIAEIRQVEGLLKTLNQFNWHIIVHKNPYKFIKMLDLVDIRKLDPILWGLKKFVESISCAQYSCNRRFFGKIGLIFSIFCWVQFSVLIWA